MFKAITKLREFFSTGEMSGLHLNYYPDYWELEGNTDFPILLLALPALMPAPAFLYLEDGSPSGELKEWLQCNNVESSEPIMTGSYGEQSPTFHIPLTHSTMNELAKLADRVAAPELAIHLHAYEPGRVILEWHDAFNNRLLIDGKVEESKVSEFARAIGFTFAKRSSENVVR